MRLTGRFLVLTLAAAIPFLGVGMPTANSLPPAHASPVTRQAGIPQAAIPQAAIHQAVSAPTADDAVPAGGRRPPTATTSQGPVDYTNNCPVKPAPGTFTCFSLRRTPSRASKMVPLTAGSTPSGFGPADLHAAYSLPALSAVNGTGQAVYVIGAYGYPNAAADLASYRSTYQLPPLDCQSGYGCFNQLNQVGGAPSATVPAYNAGWAGETALDLDMVSAICPNCSITLIEANDNQSSNLLAAVAMANNLGATFVSMSWGAPETGHEALYDAQYFRGSGVVYAASAGDGGYEQGSNYPSTSTHVVAVGGTTLAQDSTTTRGWSEYTWGNDIAHGTGSGCSSDETKPAWQLIIAGSVCTQRAATDVSAVADPDTGVAVYQTAPVGQPSPGWSIEGGTSASAPIIAAVYALAGPPRTTDNPVSYPYANAGSLNDVTDGISGYCSPDLLCSAAAGWDGPTGLGTPNNVTAFAWAAQVVTVTNPDNQASPVNTAIANLPVAATDLPAKTLAYSASNLPAGLTISSTTGVISGTPTTLSANLVTVTAQDSTGASSSAVFPWTIGGAGTFLSVQPNRLLDTRYGIGARKGAVAANGSMVLQVLGRGGVPCSGVSAVVLNVTATATTAPGYLTVYPHGSSRPATSNLNFAPGQTIPNLVLVPVGGDGKVTLFTTGGTQLVVDVSGFYLAGSPAARAGVPGSLGALSAPSRILDTRTGTGAPVGAVPAGKSISLHVLGAGGIPTTGVSAVVLNVTVTQPAAAGDVVVWQDGPVMPVTSNLNYVKGQTVANLVLAPVGADGSVRLFTMAGAHLIADVAGYLTSQAAGVAASGGTWTSVGPSRVLDTRTTTGHHQGPVGNLGTVFLKVTGAGGVAPSGVTAVALDIVAVGPTGAGFVTAYSAGSGQPATSNVNYVTGQTTANLVVVPVDSDGFVALTVGGAGTVNLIADVFGYVNAPTS